MEKVTFEERSEGGEGIDHADIRRKQQEKIASANAQGGNKFGMDKGQHRGQVARTGVQ